MPRSQLDLDKLRAAVRRLPKDVVCDLLDGAMGLLPERSIVKLVKGHLEPRDLAPDSPRKGGLLGAVRNFHEASLRQDYYEGFEVNSRNFMEQSEGTQSWIAECNRLLGRCVETAKGRRFDEARQGFDALFSLLRKLNDSPDDIIFFADEGGLWQVGVAWERVLPAFFQSLAATAEPEEYAREATKVIEEFVAHDRKRYLAAARRAAKATQRRALPAGG
ncbi:MAG: hypothetical protein HY721_19380 [Planctomycetes bacterium]|nr:hypothetical protein [Planctomycetota bacterium]